MKKTVLKLILAIFPVLLMWPVKIFALNYEPLVPGLFNDFASNSGDQLSVFLGKAFQFGLAIAAALAVVMVIWGGVEIMLSESVLKKSDGKQRISDAIWGLLLALVSWLILYIINPDILLFKI